MAHDDAVAERVGVKQAGGDRQQRVEPAAGLVDRLGDEVRREAALELLLVLERIVPLREGHGAGVVPAVDDLLLAVHVSAALGAGQHDAVDVRAVQLDVRIDVVAQLAHLLTATDDVHMAALAGPHRQRRAPVALAGETPVDDVLKEVAHAAFLDVVRHPVDGAVVGDELVAHGGHLDEPALAGVVDQRRVTAPAERIVMLELRRLDQQAALLEVREHQLVRVLDEHAGPLGFPGQAALRVHQLHERQVVGAAHARVVLAKRRRDVDDAGAVAHGDVAVADDVVELRALALHGIERLILHVLELAARHRAHDDRRLLAPAEDALHERAGHVVGRALERQLRVLLVRIDAQRDVAGQRPRGRRPGDEIGVLPAHDLEAHDRGGLLHALVALRDLMAGERGAAARAVGHDLVALVEQALLVDLLEAPPLGLDVVVVVGDIGVLHVRPVADALAHLLPLGLVLPDGLLALLDERLDAVLLDLRLAIEAEHLLDLQLDRQAVGVPAGLAQHVVALHRAVARDDVLDGARLDVADVRLAVGRGRAVKERERRSALAQLHRLLEHIFPAPELEDLLLADDEVHIGRNLLIHLVSSTSLQYKSSLHPIGTRLLAVPPKLTRQQGRRAHFIFAVTGRPSLPSPGVQKGRWAGDPSPRPPSGIAPFSGSLCVGLRQRPASFAFHIDDIIPGFGRFVKGFLEISPLSHAAGAAFFSRRAASSAPSIIADCAATGTRHTQ